MFKKPTPETVRFLQIVPVRLAFRTLRGVITQRTPLIEHLTLATVSLGEIVRSATAFGAVVLAVALGALVVEESARQTTAVEWVFCGDAFGAVGLGSAVEAVVYGRAGEAFASGGVGV